MRNAERAFHPARVVIGFDFSPLAELALIDAAELALERPRATLDVVHVIDHSTQDQVDSVIAERMRGRAMAALRALGAAPGLEICPHVLHGAPVDQILQLADALEADVIVVGTHGWRGMKRLLRGSIADKVMRDASCPVMVVRPRTYEPHPELEPEPACPDCLDARDASDGQQMWCEAHDRPYVPAHRYAYSSASTSHPYHADGIGG